MGCRCINGERVVTIRLLGTLRERAPVLRSGRVRARNRTTRVEQAANAPTMWGAPRHCALGQSNDRQPVPPEKAMLPHPAVDYYHDDPTGGESVDETHRRCLGYEHGFPLFVGWRWHLSSKWYVILRYNPLLRPSKPGIMPELGKWEFLYRPAPKTVYL